MDSYCRPYEVAAMLSPYTAGNELKKHAFMQLIIKIDKNVRFYIW